MLHLTITGPRIFALLFALYPVIDVLASRICQKHRCIIGFACFLGVEALDLCLTVFEQSSGDLRGTVAGFSDATGAIRFSSEQCPEEKRIALAGAWGAARPPNRGQGGGSSLAAGGAQHEKIAPDLRIGPDPVCVPSLAAETWNVGTWKTAQTIQPFLYEPFANGATVKVHPFTNPGDQKAALLAGSLDMTGTTLALAIQAASRGEPIVLVASLGNKCSALVVKKGGVKSVGDLEGKKIGYVPGTMHEILLRETLTRAGLNPDKDAKLVRIDFFDMGTALSRGDIDAYLSGEPLPTLAKRQGYGEILAYPYYGEGIGAINSGMIVRRDFVEKKPERVMEMLRAHRKATEQCMSDKAFWLETSSKMFGVELDVLRDAADNMELVWDMDDTFMKQLSALGKRMLELGIIKKEPDYNALVDRRFVDALRQGK